MIRLCTSADAFLLPLIYVNSGDDLNPVMYFIELVALTSFVMTLIFYFIDSKYDRLEIQEK